MNKVLKAKIVENYGSQWQFAAAVGTHEGVVSKVVRGRRELAETEKARWAEALNAPAEQLFQKLDEAAK